MPRRKEPSRYAVAADALGITHLVLGTLFIVVGEFTDFFKALHVDHGGVEFILKYLDRPIYAILQPMVPEAAGDAKYTILIGILVVMLGSIVYGMLSYFILRVIGTLFKSPD
ncbi:MAG: hypothetical protein U0136_14590 [Bdellovibrionota bacterium]